MNICVYGAASNDISPNIIKKTEDLGREMAERGHALVFGGGNNGMMGASARGAHQGGGEIIGIAPRFFNADGVFFAGCTEFFLTDTMRERKKLMEEKSDAFIVTPGGIGTFDEFFEILTLRSLGQHTKAIAVYNIDGYYLSRDANDINNNMDIVNSDIDRYKFELPISRSNIKTLIGKYANLMMLELQNELSVSYSPSEIQRIFAVLKAFNEKNFSYITLRTNLQNTGFTENADAVIEDLFDYSLIGNISDENDITFKFREKGAELCKFNPEKRILLHKVLVVYFRSNQR